MYTNFEVFFANSSFLILFISMLVYWFQASNFQTEGEFTNNVNSQLRTAALFKGPVIEGNIKTENPTFFAFFSKMFNTQSTDRNIGIFLTMIANIFLFLLLLLRWLESGHFPLSNLYESLMFLSWSLTLIHLIIVFAFSSKQTVGFTSSEALRVSTPLVFSDKKLTLKLLGSITAPCALFTNAFATFSLPKEMQEASPLVPALQSNWLMMHVTVMILSYAALILGSLLSIGFLVITKGENINLKLQSSTGQSIVSDEIINTRQVSTRQSGGELSLSDISTKINTQSVSLWPSTIQSDFVNARSALTTQELNRTSQEYKYKLARILDNLSYRVLGFGFPLLTIGILSGAVWANEAWGSYWSWDPKETWALLTWLVFAIYLHTRLTKGWEGQKPALIASLGFVTVWICFLGVNLIGEGLHSYGWLNT
uniref:Cytochrome c biogenesis protein CcsA n=1 Tax=Chlamydomonas moewusii TaxID=3054 RepID=B2X276_CHLMO|nr:heme attachment to plastid cytochrome c protein [Chlamydomonas moewusii]